MIDGLWRVNHLIDIDCVADINAGNDTGSGLRTDGSWMGGARRVQRRIR